MPTSDRTGLELADEHFRYTTCHVRYQVAFNGDLLEAFAKRQAAFDYACRVATSEKAVVEVFDSMARVGQGELWEIEPGITSVQCKPAVRSKGAGHGK